MASSFISSFGVGVESIFLPEVHSGGDADYQHYVQQEILLDASFEQIPGDEETVVGVESGTMLPWRRYSTNVISNPPRVIITKGNANTIPQPMM